jgi:hypothetical protein
MLQVSPDLADLQKHDIQAGRTAFGLFLGAQSGDVFEDQRVCLTARKLERRLRRLQKFGSRMCGRILTSAALVASTGPSMSTLWRRVSRINDSVACHCGSSVCSRSSNVL